MKIGLVRHFKVLQKFPEKAFISTEELNQWLTEYDKADVEIASVDLFGIDWQKCYSSDLPRAVKTAESIYFGNIIKAKELREVRIGAFFERNVKLPPILWMLLGKLAIRTSHKSILETPTEINNRVNRILDQIINENIENVLIVCHGLIMMFIRKELIKRGFTGPKFGTADNGKLYIFEHTP
jgi:broad specificity phosphatase PhoE